MIICRKPTIGIQCTLEEKSDKPEPLRLSISREELIDVARKWIDLNYASFMENGVNAVESTGLVMTFACDLFVMMVGPKPTEGDEK